MLLDVSNIFKNFNYFIILSSLIFVGGLVSITLAKNAIIWLLSLELLFISSFLNFLVFSIYYYNIEGYIYSLLIIILAAAESALGLSIIILYFSFKKNIDTGSYKNIKI